MPEYKRWVSYIYYYENNIKKNNIGYIRVEMKGAFTKLTVHINVLSVTEPMGVYMCVRNKGKLVGVKIGEVIMDKGVGHSVYNVETSDIMKSCYGMENMAGIIILHSKDKFYASEWDEDIIDIDSFTEYHAEVEAQAVEEQQVSYNADNQKGISEENRISENNPERSSINNYAEDNYDMEKIHDNDRENNHDNDRDNDHEKNHEKNHDKNRPEMINETGKYTEEHTEEQAAEQAVERQPDEESVDGVFMEPEREPVDNRGNMQNNSREDEKENDLENEKYRQYIGNYRMADETTERENEVNMPEGITEAAEKMLKTFPYMYPFEDDEIDACVRIEPQDIANLPIDTWLLANNSFLLKGYYGYRHLIFIKTGGNKPKYMIGVPGINHNRENFLASMFGFRLFKPIKNTSEVKGEFGYWCIGLEKRYI